jgi:hypothetical protein
MNRAPLASHRSPSAAAAYAMPASLARPAWLDYLLILFGCGVSLFLAELSGLRAVGRGHLPPALRPALPAVLPALLLLPVGILLLWPVFYTTQRLRGRPPGLAAGEWLWRVAWLFAGALSGWVAWKYWGSPPEVLVSDSFQRYVVIGYALAVLALGSIALLLTLLDLVSRWPRPWTHRFGLALFVWSALPLAALWAWDIQVTLVSRAPQP